MGALRKQMESDMVVRGMSPRTRESYLASVADLAKFYKRSPDAVSEHEVQRYLLHLIQERKLAWSSVNVAASALKFFYRVTLKRREAEFSVPGPHQPQRLPQILSTEEVMLLIEAAANPKHRALLLTTYAAGLRLSEVIRLRVSDVDSSRMTLRIEQGKGAKDRYALLSPRLLKELRTYWLAFRPKDWLFPNSRDGAKPLGKHTVHRIYHRAKDKARIAKPGGIHALRHAFATHMLEGGVNVHTIQRLMGHSDLGTTTRYFHLARAHLANTPSPLELLDTGRAAAQ
jgi:site-specific recombinase XerD